MIEFGRREAGATAVIIGALIVSGIGWSVLQQRQQATSADLKPAFSDGTPASIAGPDGTLETPADEPKGDTDTGAAFPAASPSPAAEIPSATAKPDQIVVFVSGAVKRPGVYTFKPGARIYHAVRAAGGFKANAQQDALNQAETLRDADQIYIPPRSKSSVSGAVSTSSNANARGAASFAPEMFRSHSSRRVSLPPPTITVRPLIIEGSTLSAARSGQPTETPRERGRVLGKPTAEAVTVAAQSSEPAPAEGATAEGSNVTAETGGASEPARTSGHRRSGGTATPKFKNPGDGLVNINTAGLAELQKLPGVGPSTAQKFIEYRTQIGRFSSTEQVQDIKGIGPKKFAKIKPFITL